MRFSGIERCLATLVFMIIKSGKVVLMKERTILAIVAGFPYIIERIPCSFIINKGGNVEHLTYPIICHIYVSVCVINEDTHLTHDVIPLCLLFSWNHVSCFVHDGIIAQNQGFSNGGLCHLVNWFFLFSFLQKIDDLRLKFDVLLH